MIGVNVDGADASSLGETMAKEELPWRSFADEQRNIASRWSLSATPTFYVLDPQGVIRHKWVGSPGAEAIDTALEKLIREAERKNAPR